MSTIIYSILEEPRAAFTEHLNDVNNVRILFSGTYGSGKTTFLNNYFEDGTQVNTLGEKKYITIHLYPVSYPAASNEDIFKYIKYDILYHLIVDCELVLMEQELSYLTKLPDLVNSHIDKIISTSLLIFTPEENALNISGDESSNAFELLSSFGTGLKKLLENKKASPKPNENITQFLKNVNDAEGSIYEENIITQLIYTLIQKLKQKDGKDEFQTVLIIDDLDRIDPHHIFRLFNVFAAHFDSRRELPNKFGFDKVMFVCDINNIRNIYQANYGIGTDFNGYIDKFYSKQVFKFSNKESVKEAVRSVVIKSLNYQGQDKNLTNFIRDERYLNDDMERFLSAFVQHNSINLRALFKYLEKEPIQINYKEIDFDGQKIYNWQLPSVLIFEILSNIFGDIDAVESALNACSETYTSEINYNINYRAGNALTILGYKKHKFSQQAYTIDFPEKNYCLTGTLKSDHRGPSFWTDDVKVLSLEGALQEDVKPNIFYPHLKALQLLRKLRYFD